MSDPKKETAGKKQSADTPPAAPPVQGGETVEPTPEAAPQPTVEDLAVEQGTPAWVFAGVKARNEWPIGKVIPEAEYVQAVKDWLEGPTVAPASQKNEVTA